MAKVCDLLGVSIQTGNNVSHSNRKTKRRFYPNLRNISFKSDVLGVKLNLRVATSTLRTINKYGNIDSFLVNYKFLKLSDAAQSLRNKIKKKLIKSDNVASVKAPVVKKAVYQSAKSKRTKSEK